METVLVNGEISMNCPDGFQIMSEEELTALYTNYGPARWGAWNKESRVILAVEWERRMSLLLRFTDSKRIAENNEKLMRRAYRDYGYVPGGFFSRKVGGLDATGYRFTYRLGDVSQSAESVLLKLERRIYRFSCVGRTEDEAENRKLFGEILDSVEID